MKKERIEYLVDSFTDVNGDTRHFVIAAISVRFGEAADTWFYDKGDAEHQENVKGLKLGYSICNPVDKFNEELGIQIAIGRARKNANYALLASELGFINTKLVKAFLEQEAAYFKENPESRIAGYKRQK